MKNKICKNCKEIMYYKEWKKKNLNNSDWAWNNKKFCDQDCKSEYNDCKERDKYNKKKELKI